MPFRKPFKKYNVTPWANDGAPAEYAETWSVTLDDQHAADAGFIRQTHSTTETEELGEWIGRACTGGEIIALVGPLGAGKTCLARGLARGLGVPEGSTASPTFALIHEYRGRVPVVHVDLYRLDPDASKHFGLEEYLESAAVTVIEWADRIPTLLPRDHLRMELEHAGGDRRLITMYPLSGNYQSLVRAALVGMQRPQLPLS
jgi:tRNA threonylcarbamoyladenosine biosynthesis protein TsaE